MICFEKVSKFILSDVSFCVPKGQTVGIIGPSGAGKTTLLKLACGLLAPKQGRVRVLDRDPLEARALIKRSLGVCIAGIPLMEGDDTVEEGFRMLQAIYEIPKKQYCKRYEELSARLCFKELAGSKCKDLSAGQRARVRLGAALLPEPEVLLLDEPASGLDVNGKMALLEIMTERRREGAVTLVTSHDMNEISTLCSRLALLKEGKLLYYGSERTLLQRYAPPEEITVKLSGRLPDLEDLPLVSYALDGDDLKLRFCPTHITAAEILKQLLRQTNLQSVDIHRASLEDVFSQIE
ncbi:MAG: ABC transporter ATP-binding protein [Candidatus Gastranaerophilales bacterium]|nr:ABC transporter ATP-binding protein [Candidatus Gastranaerophilales bacterium]